MIHKKIIGGVYYEKNFIINISTFSLLSFGKNYPEKNINFIVPFSAGEERMLLREN